MERRTLTVAEAAEVLGVGERWLAEQCRRGRVPHLRLGQARRFTETHIEQILAAHETRPRPVSAPLPAGGVTPRSWRYHQRKAQT